MAKTAMQAEILHKRIQPLQDLRSSARIFEKIWYLPCLLPRTGIQRTDPGCEKGKLVKEEAIHDYE